MLRRPPLAVRIVPLVPALLLGLATAGPLRAQQPDDRIAGADRYATSAAIARRAFPDGATSVYVARGDVLVDALAAGVLTDGPILLAPPTGPLPPEVAAAVAQLGLAEPVGPPDAAHGDLFVVYADTLDPGRDDYSGTTTRDAPTSTTAPSGTGDTTGDVTAVAGTVVADAPCGASRTKTPGESEHVGLRGWPCAPPTRGT